jgi:hypothetical protein
MSPDSQKLSEIPCLLQDVEKNIFQSFLQTTTTLKKCSHIQNQVQNFSFLNPRAFETEDVS